MFILESDPCVARCGLKIYEWGWCIKQNIEYSFIWGMVENHCILCKIQPWPTFQKYYGKFIIEGQGWISPWGQLFPTIPFSTSSQYLHTIMRHAIWVFLSFFSFLVFNSNIDSAFVDIFLKLTQIWHGPYT